MGSDILDEATDSRPTDLRSTIADDHRWFGCQQFAARRNRNPVHHHRRGRHNSGAVARSTGAPVPTDGDLSPAPEPAGAVLRASRFSSG
jgi:hypothetical protein